MRLRFERCLSRRREEHPSKRSLIKRINYWRDKLVILKLLGLVYSLLKKLTKSHQVHWTKLEVDSFTTWHKKIAFKFISLESLVYFQLQGIVYDIQYSYWINFGNVYIYHANTIYDGWKKMLLIFSVNSVKEILNHKVMILQISFQQMHKLN